MVVSTGMPLPSCSAPCGEGGLGHPFIWLPFIESLASVRYCSKRRDSATEEHNGGEKSLPSQTQSLGEETDNEHIDKGSVSEAMSEPGGDGKCWEWLRS